MENKEELPHHKKKIRKHANPRLTLLRFCTSHNVKRTSKHEYHQHNTRQPQSYALPLVPTPTASYILPFPSADVHCLPSTSPRPPLDQALSHRSTSLTAHCLSQLPSFSSSLVRCQDGTSGILLSYTIPVSLPFKLALRRINCMCVC
ncbi:hypothetical protein E2C01_097928 [Portunus trituberculatus]|uniref:Uncharacterized protein n=1 Tax=Portunus trituberculatus TaxID=210409 RepID=A0A5B7K5N0_PORTR|nr:hypothetical protein [Portunus trituberculatus]